VEDAESKCMTVPSTKVLRFPMRPDQGQVEVKMMDYMSHQKNIDGEQTDCCSAMFKRCICCIPKKALTEERLPNENALRVRAGGR
jgi:hypothetical protein